MFEGILLNGRRDQRRYCKKIAAAVLKSLQQQGLNRGDAIRRFTGIPRVVSRIARQMQVFRKDGVIRVPVGSPAELAVCIAELSLEVQERAQIVPGRSQIGIRLYSL